MIVLERDSEIPAHEGAAESADGAEYMACARARIGSPQFMHLHVFLKRGWCAAGPAWLLSARWFHRLARPVDVCT